MGDVEFSFQYRNKRWERAADGLKVFAAQLDRSMTKDAAVILKRNLKRMLDEIAQGMTTRHGNPWPGGTSPSSLSRRSGRAARSIISSVRVTGKSINTIEGSIGGVGYLRSHEFGAVIKPKKAQFLTVPLPPALTAKGVAKKPFARAWANTFVITSKKGNKLIVQRRGKSIVPLYVLKKRVVIPKRLGMRDAIDRTIPFFVDETMNQIARHTLYGGTP